MKKIYNFKVSTLIMISLPIISVLIGFFGVKFYLLSNNQFDDSVDSNQPAVEEIFENEVTEPNGSELSNEKEQENSVEDSQKEVTNKIKNIKFYSIQVGSFSSEENAKQFKTELIDKGYHSYELENDNFKVYVGASYEKEKLQDELKEITSISPDAFIKSIDLESKKISYTFDNKDYFLEIGQLITDQINNTNKTLDKKMIEVQLEKIVKMNALFTENENNESVGKLVTNYVEDLKKHMKIVDSNSEEKLSILLEKNVTSFVKYFR